MFLEVTEGPRKGREVLSKCGLTEGLVGGSSTGLTGLEDMRGHVHLWGRSHPAGVTLPSLG